ncbi:DinB family protein [Paenibacillus popilliae]|nr:DinB family protein [Paenibacillus sp. SDF0028]
MEAHKLSIIHQLNLAVQSIRGILEQVTEEQLNLQPMPHKRSLRDMLAHLTLICAADLHIMNEATQTDMDCFYEEHTPSTIDEMKETLADAHQLLVEAMHSWSEEQWLEVKTAYWGVAYSRFEWMLEIILHLAHHRGQLFTLLCEHVGEPKIVMFE